MRSSADCAHTFPPKEYTVCIANDWDVLHSDMHIYNPKSTESLSYSVFFNQQQKHDQVIWIKQRILRHKTVNKLNLDNNALKIVLKQNVKFKMKHFLPCTL